MCVCIVCSGEGKQKQREEASEIIKGMQESWLACVCILVLACDRNRVCVRFDVIHQSFSMQQRRVEGAEKKRVEARLEGLLIKRCASF